VELKRSAVLAFILAVSTLMGCAVGPGADDMFMTDPGPDPELANVVGVTGVVAADDIDDTATGACTGSVSDPNGQPAAGTSIELKRANAPQYDGAMAQTDDRGDFGFKAVPPGQYTVGVRDGNAIRTQALMVVGGDLTIVNVGLTQEQEKGIPGFGGLAAYLPAEGSVTVLSRSDLTRAEGETITITYGAVVPDEGRLSFTRTIGDATETVTQLYEEKDGRVLLVQETVNGEQTNYDPGLTAYAEGAAGVVFPSNVTALVPTGDEVQRILLRQLLTPLAPEELTTEDETYSAIGTESYVTELSAKIPRVIVTTTRFALGAWIVGVEIEYSGGPVDTPRGTIRDELVSFTPGG